MANYDKILAFHWTEEEPPIKCEPLLITQAGGPRPHTVKLHSHDFWQLEIILMGSMTISDGDYSYELKAGDYAIAPPKVLHEFIYKNKKIEWISIRFLASHVKGSNFLHIGNTYESPAEIIQCIPNLIRNQQHLSAELSQTVRDLLAAALEKIYTSQPSHSQNLVDKIVEFISSHTSKNITISQIAEKLNLSVHHITTTFSSATGQTLKSYIDQKRFDSACRLLLFTNNSISEIAGQLKFRDIFAFSRFFKRMASMSPKNYRIKNHCSNYPPQKSYPTGSYTKVR